MVPYIACTSSPDVLPLHVHNASSPHTGGGGQQCRPPPSSDWMLYATQYTAHAHMVETQRSQNLTAPTWSGPTAVSVRPSVPSIQHIRCRSARHWCLLGVQSMTARSLHSKHHHHHHSNSCWCRLAQMDAPPVRRCVFSESRQVDHCVVVCRCVHGQTNLQTVLQMAPQRVLSSMLFSVSRIQNTHDHVSMHSYRYACSQLRASTDQVVWHSTCKGHTGRITRALCSLTSFDFDAIAVKKPLKSKKHASTKVYHRW